MHINPTRLLRVIVAGSILVVLLTWLVPDSRAVPSLNSERLRANSGMTPASLLSPAVTRIALGTRAHWATDEYRTEMKRLIASASADLASSLKLDHSGTLSGDGRYTRALVAYFDPTAKRYETELKAVLLSIANMRLTQPANIKTDVLIFAPERAIAYLTSIGCVLSTRDSFVDAERCLIVRYVPIAEQPDNPVLGPDPLRAYTFAESHNVVALLPNDILYDMVVRSDLDTFFTPNFATYIPPPGMVIVGPSLGGYESKYALNHLNYVMRILGLHDSKMLNLGSSWYGPTPILRQVSKLSVLLMQWLYSQEYTQHDLDCFCYPEWYSKLTTMYSGYMALQQLGPDHLLQSQDDGISLDAWATGELTPGKLHIHGWHSDAFYSKLAFQDGKYRDMDLTPYLDLSTTEAYAGVLSVSAERLGQEEFKAIVTDRESMVSRKWIRALPST